MNIDILITHPGTQHSYQVALAVQEGGWKYKYITSFFYKREKGFYKIFSKFGFIDRIMTRRFMEKIDQDNVINIPIYELVEQICLKTLGINTKTYRIVYWRDRMFDYTVSKILGCLIKNVKCVIGYPNAALHTFRRAKLLGAKAIIDQPIGYYKEAFSILEEEKQLKPEFADSITYIDFDSLYIERVEEELEIADYVFIPSKFVETTFIKYGFDKSKFIYLPYGSWFKPIDKNIIKYKDGNKPLNILYVGQLSARKGIQYLLEAVKELKTQKYNIKLTMVGNIIGSGSWINKYSGVFNYFQFVPRKDLYNIYINADVFVFPSLFEGFGLVILEALSFGLPVITTPNAGAEAIKNGYNGFIIPIRDKDAIKNRLLFFYENRELLYNMKLNAIDSSLNFTWDKYRKNMRNVLSEIVKI